MTGGEHGMSPAELELLGRVDGAIDLGACAWATREGEAGLEVVARAPGVEVVVRPEALTRLARLWLNELLYVDVDLAGGAGA